MYKKFAYYILLILTIVFVTASLGSMYTSAVEPQKRTYQNISIGTASNRVLNLGGRIGLGVFDPTMENTNFQSIIDFEDMVNHKMEYVLLFRAWGDSDSLFPSEDISYLRTLNLTPIITWEPWKRDFDNPTVLQPEYSLVSIANGNHDTYIKSWAQAARNANIKIVLRFAHEMNSKEGYKAWYPWQGESDNYKKAFQRIVDIFKQEGADNVKFLWNPFLYDGSGPMDPYYPGDKYVDYIGFTAINLGNNIGKITGQFQWRDCNDLIAEQYKAVEKWNKQIIVVELLSAEQGGSKADWYSQCLAMIPQYTNIIGVISVQVGDDKVWAQAPIDWRINSSKESLKAFVEGIKNKAYK